MFGWFKSKSGKSGKGSDAASEEQILDAAIREVHPDRFVTPEDGALVVQPILATINTLVGRPDTERFFPIRFDDVVQRVRQLHHSGQLQRLIQVVAAGGDPVLAGLVIAAVQEGQPLGARFRNKTEFLISCLNRYSNSIPEPPRRV
jgi:hypothetical protein